MNLEFFFESTNPNSWSSVGALVVPDNSLEDLEYALNKLKTSCGVDISEEFKKRNRTDESKHYMEFLANLSTIGYTLHILAAPTHHINNDKFLRHKNNMKNAITVYGGTEKENIDHYSEII